MIQSDAIYYIWIQVDFQNNGYAEKQHGFCAQRTGRASKPLHRAVQARPFPTFALEKCDFRPVRR